MFSVNVPIRFSDIDAFGHVNNARYLSFFEEARIQFFDHHLSDNDWKKTGIILANAKVDFIIPILRRDNIIVNVWCSRVGTKSFDLSYEVIKNNDEQPVLCAHGLTTVVAFDYKTEETIVIPSDWKTFLLK